MKKPLFKILKLVLIVLLVLVIIVTGFFAYLSINEFNPAAKESISITNQTNKSLKTNQSISILTWNVGYASLDAKHDFFMDGGKDVNTESSKNIQNNLAGINKELKTLNPDIAFLQEVDTDSDRSYNINELASLKKTLNNYSNAFAYNFKVPFIPYPWPPIGKVNGGITTFSKYQSNKNATRIKLPTSYKWPVRLAQLKRCLLLERIPLENSDKELVLVNLHLEAYSDYASKKAQLKVMMSLLNDEYAKGNYCVAGGDFNMSFGNVNADLYPIKEKDNYVPGKIENSDLTNDFRFANDSSIPTCRLLNEPYNPKTAQFYVIDGFIVSPNIEVNKIKTVDLQFKNSDHNPVMMQIKLK